MEKRVAPIPEGYHSLTPHLVVVSAAKAIEFYGKAFGAQELYRMEDKPGGKVTHAELKLGDSIFMLADECDPHPGHDKTCSRAPANLKGTTMSLFLYVPNADEVFTQAKEAGAEVIMPVEDMFWGDRVGQIRDPFGHLWSIATHTRDLTQQQIEEGAKKFYFRNNLQQRGTS